MATAKAVPVAVATIFMFLALMQTLQLIEAQIGVCYGKYAGENLPSSQDVVNLYKQYGIGSMRIYDLDQDILRALQGSGIKAIIQVPNDNLQSVGTNYQAALQFVQTYVAPYASSIKYIAVGNEVVTQRNEFAQYVGPAMQNVLNALNNAGLGGYNIKVSTAIGTSMVVNSYPPSNGQFNNLAFMNPVVDFLAANGSPLLLNIYTYFSFDLDLSYRLFTLPGPRFTDPNNGLQYQNLFDAILDATYAALSKAGTRSLSNGRGSNIRIASSESGWKGIGHHIALSQSGWKGTGPRIASSQSGWKGVAPRIASSEKGTGPHIVPPQSGWKGTGPPSPSSQSTGAPSPSSQTGKKGTGPHIVSSQSGWKGTGAPSPSSQTGKKGTRPHIVSSQSGWKRIGHRSPPTQTEWKGIDPRNASSESGWKGTGNHRADISNDASSDATLQNAQTYYSNLINHVKGGTPLKRQPIEMYLFEMFDEANKPGEQNFGLFYADKTPKYNLNFS